MGEAKRRAAESTAQTKPVCIISPERAEMQEPLKLGRQLLAACETLNADIGERRTSAAFATAIQMLFLGREHQPDDIMNALCSVTAWALHPYRTAVLPEVLATMRRQILMMAADSAAAAGLDDLPAQGRG